MNGNSNLCGKIKSGDFQVRDSDFAKSVADLVERISLVFPEARTKKVVACMARFMTVSHKGFNARKMAEKCEGNIGMLHVCGNLKQYCEMFEEIYNHGSQKGRLPLRFWADEAARSRSNFEA